MSSSSRAAKLFYLPGSYRMMSAGDHVVCASSGVQIPLEELRYWSAEKQQAYASCELAVRALTGRSPAVTPATPA